MARNVGILIQLNFILCNLSNSIIYICTYVWLYGLIRNHQPFVMVLICSITMCLLFDAIA